MSSTIPEQLKKFGHGWLASAQWPIVERRKLFRAYVINAYHLQEQLEIPPELSSQILALWNQRHEQPLEDTEIGDALTQFANIDPEELEAYIIDAQFALPIRCDEIDPTAHKVAWVWQDYIPRSHITLFMSGSTIGKTTLLAHLVAHMSRGEPLITDIAPGRVLIVSEESLALWYERGKALGLTSTPDQRCNLDIMSRPFKGKPTMPQWHDWCAWIATIAPQYGWDLVIVDPWQCFNPSHNENDSMENVDAMNGLRAIADSGPAVVFTHHPNKPSKDKEQSFLERSRGSSAMVNDSDNIIMIERNKGGHPNQRIIQVTGRFLIEEPPPQIIQLTAQGYMSVGPQAVEGAVAGPPKMEMVTTIIDAVGHPCTAQYVATEWSRLHQIEPGTPAPAQYRAIIKMLNEGIPVGQFTRTGKGKVGDPFKFNIGPSNGLVAVGKTPDNGSPGAMHTEEVLGGGIPS